jgi:two-component system nitrogen regulation response regulator NtrX
MTSPKVIVIDDDTWIAEQYMRVLTKDGFETNHAPNAIEGIELIDEWRPDAIILDMFMPGPNGMVLLHELASHDDLAHIPLIMSTNSASDIRAHDMARYGVREILDKSTMHPEDISRAVRRALQ